MFQDFTPISATAGGVLIGLAASLMLLTTGRIAGISGIFKGMLKPVSGDFAWRAAFVLGLVIAGVALAIWSPGAIAVTDARSLGVTAAAGGIVGVGVTLGSGCTSGHGVCGLSRFSRRSMVATAVFMATGFATATALQVLFGGAL